MSAAAVSRPSVRLLLVGLDALTAAQVAASLPGFDVLWPDDIPADPKSWASILDAPGPQLAFCSAGSPYLNALLGVAASRRLPVVVVSRLPDFRQWIDAIEAGASDYVAAPFEPVHMRWIVSASIARCLRA